MTHADRADVLKSPLFVWGNSYGVHFKVDSTLVPPLSVECTPLLFQVYSEGHCPNDLFLTVMYRVCFVGRYRLSTGSCQVSVDPWLSINK